jgi:hypothetical protein
MKLVCIGEMKKHKLNVYGVYNETYKEFELQRKGIEKDCGSKISKSTFLTVILELYLYHYSNKAPKVKEQIIGRK